MVLDQLLVLDVTASRKPHEKGPWSPEIIDIGYALLQTDGPRRWNCARASGHQFVTPKFTLSESIRAETGLTEETLGREGLPYEDALRALGREFPCLKEMPWAAWSPVSRDLLFRAALARSCPTWMQVIRGTPETAYPVSPLFFDAQALFAVQVQALPDVSLKRALGGYGLTFEGNPHTAYDRAYNAARVFLRLLNHTPLKQYPLPSK